MLFPRSGFDSAPWGGHGPLSFPDPPLDLSKHDLEHPVWLSPDWPPHSDFAFAIYRIQCTYPQSEWRSRIIALRKLWKIRE